MLFITDLIEVIQETTFGIKENNLEIRGEKKKSTTTLQNDISWTK